MKSGLNMLLKIKGHEMYKMPYANIFMKINGLLLFI